MHQLFFRSKSFPNAQFRKQPVFLFLIKMMMNRLRLFQQIRHFSKYSLNDQIKIHELAPNFFKLSFSEDAKAMAIGFSNSKNITPHNFQVNSPFLNQLHELIAKKIDNDFSFIIEAGTNANSYMPIYDFREIPKYARIPQVDNVFGYVMVDGNGKMIPNTYESNNLYRLCNGKGLIKLSDFLYDEIKEVVEANPDP